jgi:hypothetical protein
VILGALLWRAGEHAGQPGAARDSQPPKPGRLRRAFSFLVTRARPEGLGAVLPTRVAALLCFVIAIVVVASAAGGGVGDAAGDFAREYQTLADAKERADSRIASWIGLAPTSILAAFLAYASVTALVEGDVGGAVVITVVELLILFLLFSLTATVGLTADPLTLVRTALDALIP